MNSNKTKLSKSILDMKFMKRTKEKVEKQQFQEEGEEYFGAGLTERMKKDSERFVIEPSYVFCENLLDGRFSYQGMNPEIERLMELEQSAERDAQEKEQETEISDQRMADCLKGFRKKRNEFKYEKQQRNDREDEPVSKKPRFLKPQD